MMKKLLNWFRLGNLETDLDRELSITWTAVSATWFVPACRNRKREDRPPWNLEVSRRFRRKYAMFG